MTEEKLRNWDFLKKQLWITCLQNPSRNDVNCSRNSEGVSENVLYKYLKKPRVISLGDVLAWILGQILERICEYKLSVERNLRNLRPKSVKFCDDIFENLMWEYSEKSSNKT